MEKLDERMPEFCLFWIDWWPLCMQKSEWASWVQALGAVVGIGLAVGLAWFQIRAMTKSQEAARIERINELYAPAIAILAAAAEQIQAAFNEALAGQGKDAFGVDELFYKGRDHYREALLAIPVSQMPTYESARILLTGRELFDLADRVMNLLGRKFDSFDTVTEMDRQYLMGHLKLWHDSIRNLGDDMERLKSRAGFYKYRDSVRERSAMS